MNTRLDSLKDLLTHELKDLYSAEKQLTKFLPKLAKAAASPTLAQAFTEHLAETERQVTRLEEAAEALQISLRGHKCPAMEGLVEEASSLLSAEADPAVLDAALIGAAQRVEHYEIAAYGTAATFAKLLDQPKVAKLLAETLAEEKHADATLNEIAESEINVDALSG